jgi:alcohol dehydrogenase class IV
MTNRQRKSLSEPWTQSFRHDECFFDAEGADSIVTIGGGSTIALGKFVVAKRGTIPASTSFSTSP